MDWVVPGSVDMSKVKFDARCEDDYRHNFGLLLDAFRSNSITKVTRRLIGDVTSRDVPGMGVTSPPLFRLQSLPVKHLVKGDLRSNTSLLKWFKGFYTTNVKDEGYDPVKARDNSDISPALQQSGRDPAVSETSFLTVR